MTGKGESLRQYHKCFLMLFTKKTLGHQVGLPPSRQYVATYHCTTQQIIDWIGGGFAALPLVMQHSDGKQHKKTLVKLTHEQGKNDQKVT